MILWNAAASLEIGEKRESATRVRCEWFIRISHCKEKLIRTTMFAFLDNMVVVLIGDQEISETAEREES